jgi:hypothetical protein
MFYLERKLEKYINKLINASELNPKYDLYLKKFEFYYNLNGGLTPKEIKAAARLAARQGEPIGEEQLQEKQKLCEKYDKQMVDIALSRHYKLINKIKQTSNQIQNNKTQEESYNKLVKIYQDNNCHRYYNVDRNNICRIDNIQTSSVSPQQQISPVSPQQQISQQISPQSFDRSNTSAKDKIIELERRRLQGQ